MNTRALQCFIKVYEKKSITAAAKEIFISPQGLSKIIKQLEAELGAELFFRGAHGMEATQSGELLYARARHICYLIDDIVKEISIINGSRNALNIVVSYSSILVIPLDVIYGFTEQFPEYQLKIKELPDTQPVNDEFLQGMDAGIFVGHEGLQDCDYEILLKGEVVLIVSREHPLADYDEISISELDNEILIVKVVESEETHPLIQKCIESGINPVVKHESENLSAVHNLCENQNVVGVSIDFLESRFQDHELKIIKLKEPIHQNLYCISKDKEIPNLSVTNFLKYLKEQGGAGK